MSTVERNVYCASYSLPYSGNESLVNAMHKSKNLYNATLWYYRQALEDHRKAREENRDPVTEYPDYYKMERKFRDERQVNYFDLPQKVSQWVLKDVQSDWRAFAKLAVWKKSLPDSDPRKHEEVSPPHYKYKDGHARLRYTKQAFSLKAVPGKIVPSGTDTALDIPKFVNPYRITQLVIEPEGDRHMRITFIYKVDLCDMLADNGKVAGADLGVNNLVTIGTNVCRGIIVDGKPLKSVNQWYNKRMAELRSLNDILYEKEINRKVETQRHRKTAKMERLSRNRRNWIRNYLHWASRRIIDFIASAGITTLVVGKNVGWKQECDMNRVNTQNFVQIPHARLIDMLSYKARQLGIACLTTEESYTSKCSFLDNEEMCHHDRYAGRRTKRGLFVSASGRKINADLNAALNMIRKVIPNAFQAQGIEALVVAPVRLLWRTKPEIGAFH